MLPGFGVRAVGGALALGHTSRSARLRQPVLECVGGRKIRVLVWEAIV